MTKYLTPKEIQALTGRHEETVTKALRFGELHGFHSGRKGRWMVREECMEAWIERRKCGHESKGKMAA